MVGVLDAIHNLVVSQNGGAAAGKDYIMTQVSSFMHFILLIIFSAFILLIILNFDSFPWFYQGAAQVGVSNCKVA